MILLPLPTLPPLESLMPEMPDTFDVVEVWDPIDEALDNRFVDRLGFPSASSDDERSLPVVEADRIPTPSRSLSRSGKAGFAIIPTTASSPVNFRLLVDTRFATGLPSLDP